jgi:hypothetical protein
MGELLRNGPGLLRDFAGDYTLKIVASDFGDRLNYVAGRAKEQLGLRAVFIRPDRNVAWAANHDLETSALLEAAGR